MSLRSVELRRIASALVAACLLAPIPALAAAAPALAQDCTVNPDAVSLLEDHSAWVQPLLNDSCNYFTAIHQPAVGTAVEDPLFPGEAWTYTPPKDWNGSDQNGYDATYDGSTSHSTTVTYTVTPVNDKPVVTGIGEILFMEDVSGSTMYGDALSTGPMNEAAQTLSFPSAVPDDPTKIASAHATATADGSSWDFHLALTLVPDACGVTGVTLTLKDDGGTANGGVDATTFDEPVEIVCVPDPPAPVHDAYRLRPDTVLTTTAATGVLANDRDPDGDPLTASLKSPAAHGALVLAADGSFTYTPDPGYVGTDGFTYSASDGTHTTDATVSLTVDGTRPTITGRSPAAGSTGQPRDARPSVTFSEAMSPSSVTASTVRLRDDTAATWKAATVTYNAATRRATLLPGSLLAAGHRYSVRVAGTVKDLAGNTLGSSASWSFTVTRDATRPSVKSRTPASGATGASRAANVTATFTEAMRSSTLTASTVRLRDTVSGTSMTAVVTYNATTHRVTLNPSATLLAHRKYQASISSGARDRAGNPLLAVSWTFTTGS